MKKIFTIFCLFIFLNMQILPAYSYQMIPEYLCQSGVKLYQQGKFNEALSEFQKALSISPNYPLAIKYIRRIERIEILRQKKKEGSTVAGRREAMETLLDFFDRQFAPEEEERPQAAPVSKPPTIYAKLVAPFISIMPAVETAPSPESINLVDSSSRAAGLIEIEQNKTMVIEGRSIKRFLVTQPGILKVEKTGPDELTVAGDNIGYTYLQIWDNQGRSTLEFFTGFPKPNIETLEEKMRLAEEKARNFKLGYSMDWSLYEDGRSPDTLGRTSYSFFHNLTLAGETPYGDLDSALSINRFNQKTDLGHYTLGLTNAKLGPFSNFNVRGFDFFDIPPDFSNLIFPGISLRGGMFNSPAFNNKIDYTVFIGQENWAGFGNLAPYINARKKSFLDGFNLKYFPDTKQEYQVTLVQGFGKDRGKDLHDFGYDILGKLKFNHWKFTEELAYDSDAFANIFDTHFTIPKLNFSAEFRDINKKFNSSTGSTSRQGELGGLFNLYYEPWENLRMQTTVDLYRDRLYPAQDNSQRANQDINWSLNYQLGPLTALRMNYNFQNDLGKLSQYRYQNANIGASKTFKLFKDINAYMDYYHQENTNYTSHSSDYVNDRVYAGIRLNILFSLYYYINKEMNWLRESFTGNRSRPNALETGLDWSSQLGKTPWYANMRFTYRDEEDTLSNLSFLSGEDYIEGYSELSYRPTSDMEVYGSCRMRNAWADNPRVTKHFEANINAGMRYLWDTGVNWQPIGNIDGFVFKDLNADGIMERNEAPVENVRVWLGKNKSTMTDLFGYYKFVDIRGRKAYINLDTSTLPSGFVLTVPATQGTFIQQHATVRLNFGINSRSEIYGYVFEDRNDNGIYDRDDFGIRDVIISLENKTTRVTDNSGRYSFSNVKSGEHTLSVDLNSLPIYYLPKVPVVKKITLAEGVSYLYNVPLKKNK